MDNNKKFMAFLESIKTDSNAKLIDNVIQGFAACNEAYTGADLGMGKSNVIGDGIMSNVPKSTAPSIDDEECDDCLPDAGEAEPEVRENMADDIKSFIELLRTDPEFKDAFLAELSQVEDSMEEPAAAEADPVPEVR